MVATANMSDLTTLRIRGGKGEKATFQTPCALAIETEGRGCEGNILWER